jgi:hypothetical protein
MKTMKNLILFGCLATMFACGGGAKEEVKNDTTAVVDTTLVIDTTVVAVDTAAVVDTTIVK